MHLFRLPQSSSAYFELKYVFVRIRDENHPNLQLFDSRIM